MTEFSEKREQTLGEAQETQDVADLVEQYLAKVESGEPVPIEEFLGPHPVEVANRVRVCLTSLELLRDVSGNMDANQLAEPEAHGVPREVGDFQITRELGRGGMGIVYEAQQLSLKRIVALKVLPFASLMSKYERQRFDNEVRAAAMLRHPQIVGIYSVGCERGLNYYAMEFIDGGSLADVVADLTTARAKEQSGQATPKCHAFSTHPVSSSSYCDDVVRVITPAIQAIHFAHQQGVIHRDLKPSNLLLDSSGDIYIADFGLARIQTDDRLTMTGNVLGTLCYMSPEQALGRVCDERSDVYSLGATLYELLTLSPMFTGDDRQRIVHAVLNESPVPPRSLNPSVPTELETIVQKAISKEPTDRYQSCAEFNDDLGRFLSRKPVLATKPTFTRRMWRWAQRNRRLATALGLLILVMAFLSVVGPVVALRQFQLVKAERTLKEEQQALTTRLQHHVYASDIRLAHQVLENGDFDQAIDLLRGQVPKNDAKDLRGLEWFYLWKRCEEFLEVPSYRWHCGILHAAVSPNEKYVVLGGWDGTLVVRRTEDFESHWARIWKSPYFKRALPDITPDAHKTSIVGAAFSTDSNYVMSLSIDGVFKIWRTSSGELVLSTSILESPDGKATALAVSSQGAIAYATTHSGQSRVQIAKASFGERKARLEEVATLEVGETSVVAVDYSASGNLLAVGAKHAVQVWNMTTHEKQAERATSHVQDVAFSPAKESELASVAGSVTTEKGDSEVTVWDLAESATRSIPVRLAVRLEYSRDGEQFVVSSQDGYVHLFDAASREEQLGFRADRSKVIQPKFIPGHGLCTCSLSGWIRLWDIDGAPGPSTTWQSQQTSRLAGYPTLLTTKNGERVFLTGPTKTVILDGTSGESVVDLPRSGIGESEATLSLSPDETLLAESYGPFRGEDPCGLVVHNLMDGSKVKMQGSNRIGRSECDFSLDGQFVATGQGTDVVIFEAATGRLVRKLEGHQDNVGKVRYVANSNLLTSMVPGSCREMFIWNLNSGEYQELVAPLELAAIDDFAVSHNGKLLAIGGRNGTIILYDMAEMKELRRLSSKMGRAFRLEFSPSDDRLAAGGSEEGVQLWDPMTGDLLLRFETRGSVWGLCFTGDGRTLYATDLTQGETRIHRWHAGDAALIDGRVSARPKTKWLATSVIFPESWANEAAEK